MVDPVGRGKRPIDEAGSSQGPATRARVRSPSPQRPAEGELAPRTSTGPIGPRRAVALTAALQAVETFTDRPLPAATDGAALRAWGPQALVLRRASARAMTSIAHADDKLPPHHANQATAKLSFGSQVLRQVARELNLPESSQQLLAGLVLKAQHHARGVHHNALPADAVAPMELFTSLGPARDACTSSRSTPDRTALHVHDVAVALGAEQTRKGLGTIAHESVHEAQSNIRLGAAGPREPVAREPVVAPAPDHARLASLAVARMLPIWDIPPAKPLFAPGHPAASMHYQTNPWETQAFIEHGVVRDLIGDHRRGFDGAGGLQSALRPLVLELVAVSNRLSTEYQSDPQDARMQPGTPGGPVRRYEAAHSAHYQQVERLLMLTADLASASSSHGWNAAAGEELAEALARRIPTPGAAAGRNAGVDPQVLADAFEAELSAVMQRHGVKLGQARRTPVSEAEFTEARESPALLAARRVERFSEGTAMSAAALQSAFTRALDEAGFVQELLAINAPNTSNAPNAPNAPEAATTAATTAAIERAVSRMVGRLLGLPSGTSIGPEVHLYTAPNETLPHVEGMNLHPGQARKMAFDPLTWQVHVPAHLLEPPMQRAGRLARVAFDVAFFTDRLRQPSGAAMHQHDLLTLTAMSGHALRMGEGAAAQQRASDPTGVASALRAVTARLPPARGLSHEGRLFHEGPRAQLKQAAQGGDEAAREHYQTNAVERWKDPAVALRRAFAAAAEQAMQEALAKPAGAASRASESPEAPRGASGSRSAPPDAGTGPAP